MSMDAKSRKALGAIRRCVEDGRCLVLPHFVQRMDQRGLFWPDVLAVLDDPMSLRDDGLDRWDRPKWIVAGESASGEPLELVCVLDRNEHGELTVFITIY